MSENWDWEWIERINGDLTPLRLAAEELEMVLCEYLGEEPQSGPTYDVSEPPAPELAPIGQKHEIRLAVIEVEAQCELLYGRRILPPDGLDLWKQLRRCNGDEESDGQRREKIVKKFRRWVSRLAGKLNFILGSRSTGQENKRTSGPEVSPEQLQQAQYAKPYREKPGSVYPKHPNREEPWPYSQIYGDYRVKHPEDSAASPDTIRHAYNRYGKQV